MANGTGNLYQDEGAFSPAFVYDPASLALFLP